MNSSNEELKLAPSTSNAHSEWTVEKTDEAQNLFKKVASSDRTRDISIKLTRSSRAKLARGNRKKALKNKILKEFQDKQFKSRKRPPRWKNGCLKKRKSKLRAQREKKFTETESVPGPVADATVKSLDSTVNKDAVLYKGAQIVVDKLHIDTSDNSKNNNGDLTVSTHEEDRCKRSYISICARVLPYKVHQKWKGISNRTDVAATPSDISLSSESTEQDACNKTCESARSLAEVTRTALTKSPNAKQSKPMDTNESAKQHLEVKRMFAADNVSLTLQRKRQRLLSDDSVSAVATKNNIEMIPNNNSINSRSFHEDMEQETTRPNMRINHKLQVVLTRVEDMDDASVIKWRRSSAQSTLEVAPKSQTNTKCLDEVVCNNQNTLAHKRRHIEEQCANDVTTKRRSFINSLHLSELMLKEEQKELIALKNNAMRAKIVSKNLSRSSVLSSNKTCFLHNTLSNLNSSDMQVSLRKKYKLFKKPRVLLIKLEYLKYCCKNGKYSAAEIEHLTEKYVNNVIKSIYPRITQRKKGNINSSTSSTQSINKSEELAAGEHLRDTEENCAKVAPFKKCRKTSLAKPKSPDKVKNKKNLQQQQTLLEIWQNAFHVKLKPNQEKTNAKQPTQLLSKTQSVLEGSSNKSTDTGCKSISSYFAASTLTSSKNQKEIPVTRHSHADVSQKHAKSEGMSTNRNETVNNMVVNHVNLPSNTNVDKIIPDTDKVPQFNDNVSKNPRRDLTEKCAAPDVFPNRSNLRESSEFYVERDASDRVSSRISKNCQFLEALRPPSSSKQKHYKCVLCSELFEHYRVLLEHMKNSCKRKSASTDACGFSHFNSTKTAHDSESPEPSTSQQSSAVNKENASQTSVGYSVKTSLASSITSDKTLGKKFGTPQPKQKSRSLSKSRSADFDSKTRTENPKSTPFTDIYKQLNCASDVTCMICSQTFKTYLELSKHILHHTNQLDDSNNQADTARKTELEGATAKEDINRTESTVLEQANAPLENGDKSNGKSPAVSAPQSVSERDVTEGRSNTQNLSQVKHAEENAEMQSASAEDNETIKEIQRTKVSKDVSILSENPNVKSQLSQRVNVCKCHDIKSVDGKHIYIEMVIYCETCQVHFRRFECFEGHFQCYTKTSKCVKDRKCGRNVKLLCNNCYKLVDDVQNTLDHLKTHIQPKNKIVAGFRCNICKVIFYGFGNLFKLHFYNHVKNPFFLASHLSFPRFSYIGSTLIKMPTVNNDNLLEKYIQVADYLCRKCFKVFPTDVSLQLHNTNCKSNSAAVGTTSANDGSSNSTASRQSVSSSEKLQILQICGFCNKTFYNKTSFDLHSLEHKQKRELHPHYIAVSVTAVMKIYICKVCTTVCQSLKRFEEHWATHGTLQEDYVCSHCSNHYDSFELFKLHAFIHKNANEKQKPISCKVIYRDVCQNIKDQQEHALMNSDDLLRSTCFKETESTSDNSHNDLVSTSNNCQSARLEVTSSDMAHKDAQDVKKDVNNPLVPERTNASSNTMTATQSKAMRNNSICATNDHLENETASRNIEENIEESEESEIDLVIEVSESEESSVLNEMRQKADSTQKDATTADSVAVATSNDANSNSNAKATSIPARESVIVLESPSKSKTTVADKNIASTSTTSTMTETARSNCGSSLTTSNDDGSKTSPSKDPLPKNVMSVVPKSFLRVKSLAELMNSPQEYQCETDRTSLVNKSQNTPPKPQFDPSMYALARKQNPPNYQSATTSNASPVFNPQSNPSTQMINTAKARPYQVIGVKPLINVVKCIEVPKTTNESQHRRTWFPQSNNSTVQPQLQSQFQQTQRVSQQFQQVSQQKQFQQNLSSYIIQPSKMVQTVHQQQKQPQQFQQQQQPQQFQQQRQQQQQQQQLQQQSQQLQPLLQQQQLLQQHIQPSQQQQKQQLQQQQNASTVSVKPFIQTNMYQPTRTSLPVYIQPQQQPTDASNKFLFNYVLSKESVPYQLSMSNAMPVNAVNNIASIAAHNMRLQVSQNPELYICLCCPDFKCSTVQDFALHERTQKHSLGLYSLQ